MTGRVSCSSRYMALRPLPLGERPVLMCYFPCRKKMNDVFHVGWDILPPFFFFFFLHILSWLCEYQPLCVPESIVYGRSHLFSALRCSDSETNRPM